MSAFTQQLERYQQRANTALEQHLPQQGSHKTRLEAAMSYASMGGGKRVRPILTYATGSALGIDLHRLDVPAIAVEMVHAYSLVHDDLPAMDDDDLRRGQPTCHKKFDEATAILAGDALQALSFTLLAENPDPLTSAENKLGMIRLLGDASGSKGMAAGQATDLAAVGRQLSLEELEEMHRHKTGALISAAVTIATLCLPQDEPQLRQQLENYAAAVGLAFQIVDDILDVVSDTATLGKTQGADRALNKPTYPALQGLDGARQHADEMQEMALDSLAGLGREFEQLRELARFIVSRSH